MHIVVLSQEISIILNLLIATLLGIFAGFEREKAGKPAGLRTYTLITAGAALFTMLGLEMIQTGTQLFPGEIVRSDPVRIIEAIIVGVSFIGAGTIIKDGGKNTVQNLTTAAGILLMTGVGISVALHKYITAIIATGIVILVNRIFLVFERNLAGSRHHRRKGQEDL